MINFSTDTPEGKHLQAWWESLNDTPSEKALLRRASSVNDVAMSRAFHQLCNKMRPFMNKEYGSWEDQMAAVAGLISHVRHTTEKSLAEQMAGDPPTVSELRFRRLLQRDRDDLYVSMIRILKMLEQKANIFDLANSVFYWGSKVKKRWAYVYFPKTPSK